MIEALWQDVRFATRSLVRARGVALVAVVSLAFGIGANATVFSLVQAVEFPSFIYPNASRIVFLESGDIARDLMGMPVSAPDALDIASASRTLRQNPRLSKSVAPQNTMLSTSNSDRMLANQRRRFRRRKRDGARVNRRVRHRKSRMGRHFCWNDSGQLPRIRLAGITRGFRNGASVAVHHDEVRHVAALWNGVRIRSAAPSPR